MGGDRIHFYIEKREIEHHYYNFHIYCSFLLILKNQDLNFNTAFVSIYSTIFMFIFTIPKKVLRVGTPATRFYFYDFFF